MKQYYKIITGSPQVCMDWLNENSENSIIDVISMSSYWSGQELAILLLITPK